MSDKPPSAYRVEAAIVEFQKLRERLLSDDPTLAEDETTLAQLLGNQIDDIEEIQTRLVKAIWRAEKMVEDVQEERAQLAIRGERFLRRKKMMRETLLSILQVTGKKTNEMPIATLVRKDYQKRVRVTNVNQLPQDFVEEVPQPSLRKPKLNELLTALQDDGEIIDGADLFTPPSTLNIKRN